MVKIKGLPAQFRQLGKEKILIDKIRYKLVVTIR